MFFQCEESIAQICVYKCEGVNVKVKSRQKIKNSSPSPQCPVNCLAWSPFNDEAFLSGSSDWTIQLWRRDQSQPVMSFISTQRAVVDIKWSPKKATVFAAIKEEVLEIWDLSANM